MTKQQYQRMKQLGGKPAWAKARARVLARALYRCENCGAGGRVEVHHKTALELDGNHDSDNLAALCVACHGIAHGYNSLTAGQWEWQNLVREVSQ